MGGGFLNFLLAEDGAERLQAKATVKLVENLLESGYQFLVLPDGASIANLALRWQSPDEPIMMV